MKAVAARATAAQIARLGWKLWLAGRWAILRADLKLWWHR